MFEKIKQIVMVGLDWVKINPVYAALFVMMILMIVLLLVIANKLKSNKIVRNKGKKRK